MYLYVWEDNSPETFSVALEGQLVQASYNSGGAANLSGIEVWRNGSTQPTPTATPTLPPAGTTFVRGINFNGNAVTIEGNAWQSYSTALANGLAVSAPNLTTTLVTPSPATDSATSAMLNSVVWKSAASLNMTQTLTNGNYKVYIWVMENHQSNFRSFNLNLEGAQVASAIGNLSVGSWVKYGPYNVTVGDGSLNLDLIRITGEPHIMGLAIYQ